MWTVQLCGPGMQTSIKSWEYAAAAHDNWLTAADDNWLTAADDNWLTAADDNWLTGCAECKRKTEEGRNELWTEKRESVGKKKPSTTTTLNQTVYTCVICKIKCDD